MVGTLTNQNPASSVRKACKAHKARKVRKAQRARKARKVVGTKSGFDLVGDNREFDV